jgi:hypothetical protein
MMYNNDPLWLDPVTHSRRNEGSKPTEVRFFLWFQSLVFWLLWYSKIAMRRLPDPNLSNRLPSTIVPTQFLVQSPQFVSSEYPHSGTSPASFRKSSIGSWEVRHRNRYPKPLVNFFKRFWLMELFWGSGITRICSFNFSLWSGGKNWR